MKYLKMLGLAAVAAAALTALLGTGTASATVLCHTTTTPCSQKWTTGTGVEFNLQTGTSALWQTTGGIALNTCLGGTLKGTISNQGSSTETVKISVPASGFSWSSCTTGQQTIEGGEIEIHAISGSDNGTITMKGFAFTTNTAQYGVCTYTAGTGAHLGTITASKTGAAVIDFEVVLNKKEGSLLCPPDITWWEHWLQNAPRETPLFVEPS
jgi:hypothetical protein